MEQIDKVINSIPDRSDFRSWIKTPFTIKDYVYSTDSYIIVRCPRDKCDLYPYLEKKRRQAVLNLFPEVTNTVLSIKLESLESAINSIQKIDELYNKEYTVKCDVCAGKGSVEWTYEEYTKNMDCPKCDGEGEFSKIKKEKTGNKILPEGKYIDILNNRFSAERIEQVISISKRMNCDIIDVAHQSDTKGRTFLKIGLLDVLLQSINKNLIQDVDVVHSFNLKE